MTRWIISLAMFVVVALAGAGCGGGSCGRRSECCSAIEGAPSNSTVAYIRGACRIDLNRSNMCSRSLDTIHERIARSPGDTVPAACMP